MQKKTYPSKLAQQALFSQVVKEVLWRGEDMVDGDGRLLAAGRPDDLQFTSGIYCRRYLVYAKKLLLTWKFVRFEFVNCYLSLFVRALFKCGNNEAFVMAMGCLQSNTSNNRANNLGM